MGETEAICEWALSDLNLQYQEKKLGGSIEIVAGNMRIQDYLTNSLMGVYSKANKEKW